MTLAELCHHVSHFRPAWDQSHAKELARRFGPAMDRQTGLMSGGERCKAAILLALAAGLDPVARRGLIDALIESLGEDQEQTVLFSTHIIQDLERVADHVGIMEQGRLVNSASLEELQSSTKRVQIVFPGAAVREGFMLPGEMRAQTSGPVYTAVVRLARADALEGLPGRLGARVDIFPLGLEDIFIEIIGKN
jgi:ABC-2 type transport system ATP-binding protein